MNSNLKQKLLAAKSEKHRLLARRFLKEQGGVDCVFADDNPKPSDHQFEDICVAAKYGPGDPLFAGGDDFALGHLIRNLNQAFELIKNDTFPGVLFMVDGAKIFNHGKNFEADVDEGSDEINARAEVFPSPHYWGNIYIQCVVSIVLEKHLTPIDVKDFTFNRDRGIYLDKETQTIGFRIFIDTLRPIKDFPCRPDDGNSHRPSNLKSNEFFSLYTIQFGVANEFDSLDDADKHGVKGHERHLASGKVVPVRSHDRTNPTRGFTRKFNNSEVKHVVYRAFDKDGILRYIGEGKENRPQHVNSGASHNFKLNEHYFLKGKMTLEIIETGLSKEESLAIEYLLIKKHAGCDLWNIKDNEPNRFED